MPKLKTKNAVKKRFKLTASGKVKFKRPGMRHLQNAKNKKHKRHMRRAGYITGAFAEHLTVLLGGK